MTDLTVEILKQIRDGIGTPIDAGVLRHYHRGVRADDIRVELLKQIRDQVNHLGDPLGRRMDRLGKSFDHLETSVERRLEGTDHRLDRVEPALSTLSKVVRQYARTQARQVQDSKLRVAKLEKRRGF